MEVHSVSYALASLKGKIVMVDISKDDLLKQIKMKEKIFFSLIAFGILAISTIFALLMHNII